LRIVSLLSSATEILFAIGAGPDVVAISHECDYPPEATRLPRATRSLIDSSRPSQEIDEQVKRIMEAGDALYEINRELIRDLKPDLIVTQAQCDVCAVRYQDVVDFVAAEPALRATNVLALNPQSLSEILEDIRRVGEAIGDLPAAHSYIRMLGTRIVAIANSSGTLWPGGPPDWEVPTVRAPPRVVCLEWLNPLMAAGNWTPELIDIAGGQSCLAAVGKHSGYVNWTSVLSTDPDLLLVAPCGFDLARSQQEARSLSELPGFGNLSAIRSGRAFVIDGNSYLNRSGPRIVDTLEILAYLIRPDLFAPPEGELAEGRAWARL